jgi:transcriptional regulator with GAF, ATPase, and Fis domain
MTEIPIQDAITVVARAQQQTVTLGKVAAAECSADAASFTLRGHRTRAEIRAIRLALEHSGWIRKRAARLLQISYRSLLYKIQRYKITRA